MCIPVVIHMVACVVCHYPDVEGAFVLLSQWKYCTIRRYALHVLAWLFSTADCILIYGSRFREFWRSN